MVHDRRCLRRHRPAALLSARGAAGAGLVPTRFRLARHSALDDLRSSAGLSTRHSCFVCASDTVALTGRLVAEPGVAYAHERIG